MNPEGQQNEGKMEISTFLNNNQRMEVLNKPNIHNEEFRDTIIDLSGLMKRVFDKLQSNDDLELRAFEDKLNSLTHRSIRNVTPLINEWMDKRRDLIRIMNSTADELDNNFLWATLGRLFGSTMDLLFNIDSICDKNISGFLTEQAFALSNHLGVCTQLFCSYVPHLTYVGLLSSLGDVMKSQMIVRKTLKVLKEDISLFDEIQELLKECHELNQSIENMYPLIINNDLITDIQNYFSECDSYSKIFTLAYISTIGRHPAFLNDRSKRNLFLRVIDLFSRSDIAKEWFDSCLQIDHGLAIEARKLEFRNELMECFKCPSDTESTVEIGSQVVKMKTVPHLVQASINCMSIYYASNELMQGVKHKNSDIFRDKASKAKKILDIMVAFKTRLESM